MEVYRIGDDLGLPKDNAEYGWVRYADNRNLDNIDIPNVQRALNEGWRPVGVGYFTKNSHLRANNAFSTIKIGLSVEDEEIASSLSIYGINCIFDSGLILMERSLHIKSPIASEKMTKAHEEKVNSLTYEIYKFKSRVEKLTESHNAIRKNLIEASERADEMSELMENEWI